MLTDIICVLPPSYKEPEPEVDDSACVKFLEEHFDATLEALRWAIY